MTENHVQQERQQDKEPSVLIVASLRYAMGSGACDIRYKGSPVEVGEPATGGWNCTDLNTGKPLLLSGGELVQMRLSRHQYYFGTKARRSTKASHGAKASHS